MPQRLGQKRKPPGDKIDAQFKEKTGVVETHSAQTKARAANIKTVADAIRASKLDLTVWEIEKGVVNSWEVTIGGDKTETERAETYTNFQVKLFIRRIVPTILEVALERLLVRMAKLPSAKVHKIVPAHVGRRYLLEVSLLDAHFGLLAWNRETGDDYDLKQAEQSYELAMEDLLAKTEGCLPEKVVLPFGNDFFHVNNPEGVTPRGHNSLDVDGRLCKVIETGEVALVKAVQRCLAVAPVHVLWIPGNHDPETSYYMCRVIKARFHDNPNVVVDVEPPPRKFVRFGCNLIGYTHGNEEQHASLPTIMATERRQDWAECRHFEWHTGHFHKKKEMRYAAGDTYGGVLVKTLPSISGTDAWHFKKGYVKGLRMAEASLFDFERGPVATYTSLNLRHKDLTARPAGRKVAA